MALERGLERLTPQAAPAPPSEGPSTMDAVLLQWSAPPPVLSISPRIYLLDYLLNGANPQRTLLIEVGVVNVRGLY